MSVGLSAGDADRSEKEIVLETIPNDRKDGCGGTNSIESVLAREKRFRGNSTPGSHRVSKDAIDERVDEKDETLGRARGTKTHGVRGEGGS